VLRTVQLLRYFSDAPLRRRVTAATNKVEAFNGFSQWIGFGNGGVITDNDPVEQEKTAKTHSRRRRLTDNSRQALLSSAMTEPTYLHATRVAYDTVAVDYAKLVPPRVRGRPVRPRDDERVRRAHAGRRCRARR
jgi:hypothetical protein